MSKTPDRVRFLSWPGLRRRRGEAVMHTIETDATIRQEQRQLPTLGARTEMVTSGRCLGWLRRLWQWCAGCLPVGRRHRSPPRLENVRDAHHKQVQQLAATDSLDQLTQEKPSLRITIYTNLWR